MRRNAWLFAVGLGLIIVALWGIGAYSMRHNDRSPTSWPIPTSTTIEESTPAPTHTVPEPPTTPEATITSTLLPATTIASSDLSGSPTSPAVPSQTPPNIPSDGRFIFVHQGTQLVHVYEDGVAIRTMPCSTGLPDPQMNTPAWAGVVGEYWGTFFAYDVYADEAWYLFKSLGSILIHSSPYTLENGVKVYQEVEALGVRPASHGCIRISTEDARWFTEWGPEGVPVVITPLEEHADAEDPK